MDMRLEQLTFTRFIAAISILIYHTGKDIYPFSNRIIWFFFQNAHISVSYFFILSGYVMIITYGNRDKIEFKNFLKRRFARIYPVYCLAILMLIVYFTVLRHPIDIVELVLNFTLTQCWIPGFALSLNSPGWSLAVEFCFYFLFPLIYNHFYKKYSFKRVMFSILIFFIISQLTFHILRYSNFFQGFPSKSYDLIFFFPIMHLNEFFIGNLAGVIFMQGFRKKNYDLEIVGLVVCIVFLLKSNTGLNYHNGMLAIVFVPLIILISLNDGIFTKILNWKFFVFLGEISYCIYILQLPIYTWTNLLMRYLKVNDPALIFYSGLIILFVFSIIIHKYVEIPLGKLIIKKRTALI